jgi:hypothetical protein
MAFPGVFLRISVSISCFALSAALLSAQERAAGGTQPAHEEKTPGTKL